MAPIHQAARKNDVVALQRELDAGVSPDLRENDFSGTYRPLADVIVFGSAVRPPETIHRRLACIEALLEAGASLEPRICALLMRAGAKLPIPGPGSHQWLERSPYLLKIHRTPGGFLCRSQNCTTRAIGALDDLRTGGFRAYEKAHRQRLTGIFPPKFQSLPAEIVSHIVSFGFNCGCY